MRASDFRLCYFLFRYLRLLVWAELAYAWLHAHELHCDRDISMTPRAEVEGASYSSHDRRLQRCTASLLADANCPKTYASTFDQDEE